MKVDKIYSEPVESPKPFEFDATVAEVFDDMILRSVPGYGSIQETTLQLTEHFSTPKSVIYDLGCSSGTTLIELGNSKNIKAEQIVGVDSSPAMLEKAKIKLAQYKLQTSVKLKCSDILDFTTSNASVVILNYTLQFLLPESRSTLLKSIYKNLNLGGIIILSEKIFSPNPELQKLISKNHTEFKSSNGYSSLEISQKRDSIENVLRPLSTQQNWQLLESAGFSQIEMFQAKLPFVSFLAIK